MDLDLLCGLCVFHFVPFVVNGFLFSHQRTMTEKQMEFGPFVKDPDYDIPFHGLLLLLNI
jgi:hypothetical protein